MPETVTQPAPAGAHLTDEDIAAGFGGALPAIDLSAFPVRSSRTIAALATALAAAQGKIVGAEKDRENPHLKSKYATLDAVWDACRAPLSENGLAVLQPATTEGNRVTVNTILMHKTGEWVAETLSLTASQGTPQAVGTAITYARRYSLSAMVGIAPSDDDDGNMSSGTHPQAERNRQEFESRRPPTAAPRPSQNGGAKPPASSTAAPAAVTPPPAAASVGVIVGVKDLPSGALAVQLDSGFRCAAKAPELMAAARDHHAKQTRVELSTTPAKDPSKFLAVLDEIAPAEVSAP